MPLVIWPARPSNQPMPLLRGWKWETQMSLRVTEKVLLTELTKETAKDLAYC